jgi:hypothetical protein
LSTPDKARAAILIRDFGGKGEQKFIMDGQSEAHEGRESTAAQAEGDDSTQPLYLPLINGHIIRLLELQPGAQNDPVVIRLFLVELEHAPDYEALSYVWGDTKTTLPIICNGRPFNVTARAQPPRRVHEYHISACKKGVSLHGSGSRWRCPRRCRPTQ